MILCIDCKSWSRGRYKKSGLREAARLQEERVNELKKFLKKSLTKYMKFKKEKKIRFVPLVITLFEEDLTREGSTVFVPIWKLNSFLQEIENYI